MAAPPRAVKGATKEAVYWLENRGGMLLLPPRGVTDVGLAPPSIMVGYCYEEATI